MISLRSEAEQRLGQDFSIERTIYRLVLPKPLTQKINNVREFIGEDFNFILRKFLNLRMTFEIAGTQIIRPEESSPSIFIGNRSIMDTDYYSLTLNRDPKSVKNYNLICPDWSFTLARSLLTNESGSLAKYIRESAAFAVMAVEIAQEQGLMQNPAMPVLPIRIDNKEDIIIL